MATKSFNDICVEYAHKLGKGLPLTAPEMCNAVIMYLNAQITEMQCITTALQTAVSEAESSATEATNTANELSEKVDTLQTNVTEAESNATEALNKANDVSETVNALPKVPAPTTSDNGKVIGVQSGAYALVEQSGGEVPANMVTTDGIQTIYSTKYFKVPSDSDACAIVISKDGYPLYNCLYPGMYKVNNTANGFTTLRFTPEKDGKYTLTVPNVSDTLAVKADIPDLDNYTGTVDIVQGTAGSGIAVHDTVKASPYTKYGYDKIETYGNANALQYTLNIPNKNGTIATLDDIGSSSGSKLYSHYITMTGNTTVGGESVTSNVTFNLITDRPNSYDFLRLVNYLDRGGFSPNVPFSGYIGDDTLTGLYIKCYNNDIYISCIRDNDIISIDDSPSLSTIVEDTVIEL